MLTLKEALSRMIALQKENIAVGGGLFDVYGQEYGAAVVEAAKSDSATTWNILRHGTDDEFSELLNWLDDVGGEYDEDAGCREIIGIARMRGTPSAIDAVRIIYPTRFDHFFAETDEPMAKSRTFGQMLQPIRLPKHGSHVRQKAAAQ